jgi:hypothetical protein
MYSWVQIERTDTGWQDVSGGLSGTFNAMPANGTATHFVFAVADNGMRVRMYRDGSDIANDPRYTFEATDPVEIVRVTSTTPDSNGMYDGVVESYQGGNTFIDRGTIKILKL